MPSITQKPENGQSYTAVVSRSVAPLTWCMHAMTLMPIAHLAVGIPVWGVLFVGSLLYVVGLACFALSWILPFDAPHALAMTYTVIGKGVIGSTLYSGWPLPLMSMIPLLYGIGLLGLKRRYRQTSLAAWVGYDIDTLWRAAWISLCTIVIALILQMGTDSAMWLSGGVTSGYLLLRVARFYLPWRHYLNRPPIKPVNATAEGRGLG
ncbi:hypothetical protein L4C36_18700 [Photobacterium japonica]|uniref:hypothetical protein n=1 Tax=Photobacterium japonica TaxID=2910235 RepID=UPI003D09D62A